ncbi:MAG: exodeoxyribonuclease VII small subunit [Alphaproteobacteria bacterium RIFCSPLOWO2_01_FULL_45_8]|nr:MAG: exodeoxyribonuclease VII small subunit [Alphaproteobacteria bacterium GWB1_45_5]OFW76652.1 MAG: exodeoxyribonuclease VII small subunit [Alphaproteobacteria bacterium GWA1_45_9]OFW89709.1 MAG: exodeoxyribonuclease VII small subunit [Alphaproteobacteria bacterium RIFCSPHIGHO2_01_FULL_41_14]OFW96119.1 MAG: exodeoxyribonuclease VII small subunit [Alphaproteobacteria bacterium RIFCSPLOWO2_01_FULL_45_8]HCI49154.1 exodeoxyribonuclease VII small subunit [Holosporales bacterium]
MTKPETSPLPENFEQAMGELETIVRQLESGQDSLENSISLYERGIQLKKYCENQLEDAQMKIEKLTFDALGAPAKSETLK